MGKQAQTPWSELLRCSCHQSHNCNRAMPSIRSSREFESLPSNLSPRRRPLPPPPLGRPHGKPEPARPHPSPPPAPRPRPDTERRPSGRRSVTPSPPTRPALSSSPAPAISHQSLSMSAASRRPPLRLPHCLPHPDSVPVLPVLGLHLAFRAPFTPSSPSRCPCRASHDASPAARARLLTWLSHLLPHPLETVASPSPASAPRSPPPARFPQRP